MMELQNVETVPQVRAEIEVQRKNNNIIVGECNSKQSYDSSKWSI